MQNNPEYLLSVCIPTYNRAKLLPIALDSILNQFQANTELSNLVEVVVSDNAGSDNTGDIVAEYQKKFPQVKYFRNQENIGGDLNLANSVVKATGKYAWYLGDDDALVPGSLNQVVKVLNQFQPAVVGVGSGDLLDPTRAPGKEFSLQKKDPIVVTNFQEFMEKRYCLGILSVILFDRSLWLEVDYTKLRPLWLYYESVLILMAKAKQRNFVYINQPVVLTGVGYGWIKNGGELYTFMGWKGLLNDLVGYGYNKTWVSAEDKKLNNRLLYILFQAKGHDLSMELKHLKLIYKNFSGRYFYLILATIIFFIPNFIVKVLRSIKKWLLNRYSKTI
jgi:glycosyltransferase involved in cell wall biosynthesis